jgi:glycosyltransferase involved in cell wall biosynthesis
VRNPPPEAEIDGVGVRYVRFLSPPRPLSYASWGRWAGPPLGRALDTLWRSWPFDLVHAHYAVPGGDAALRWIARAGHSVPLVVSVHGGDLSYVAARSRRGHETVARVLRDARAVVANSEMTRRGIEEVAGQLPGLRVIHPGADLPPLGTAECHADPTLVTVANLEGHKNQAAVVRALAALRDRHPKLRYRLVGKGPDRAELGELSRTLGVADRVTFLGALPHADALAELARCHLHVMPSIHDAFGVAHIEAMAAGVPTVGAEGTGAEDIAQAGEGILLVPAGDASALPRTIDRLLTDTHERARLGDAARRTVEEHFTWARNGEATTAIYSEVTRTTR